jgi:hypothetical protein
MYICKTETPVTHLASYDELLMGERCYEVHGRYNGAVISGKKYKGKK